MPFAQKAKQDNKKKLGKDQPRNQTIKRPKQEYP
jgi:hypothetical protein